jgi:hypothetical protein
MRAFYDRTGYVKLWLHPNETWFLDVNGHPLAYIEGDGVYDFKGRHVGWWDGMKIRDHEGRMLVVDREAAHLGTITPTYHPRPTEPTIEHYVPVRPTLHARPSRHTMPRWEWADVSDFLDGLAAAAPLYL